MNQDWLGVIHKGCGCPHLAKGIHPKADSWGQGEEGGQPNADVRIKEIMVFICYFIIRKYLLSNMNLIFHNSVLDEYDLAVSNFF